MKPFSHLSACLFIASMGCTQQQEYPNIILLMSDDQGWGETAYYGHPYLITPVLDEMANNGLRLDRFYAASPVCTPTRASVLTGRHANRSGAFAPNWSTRPEEITIGHILQEAGFRTAHFGKWHVGPVKKDSPLNPARMGFDEYLSHDNFFELDPPLSLNGEPPKIYEGESSIVIVEAARKFIRKVVNENKPFFTIIWFGSPHSPYLGVEEDLVLYSDITGEEVRNRFAEITAMDRAIGLLRKELKDLGVAKNTLLWFCSDNGISIESVPEDQQHYMYNADLRGRKGMFYEGGIRVPGIIEWPAVINKPFASGFLSVTSDILPTLLDIMQLEHPDPNRPIDGISLKKLIKGKGSDTRNNSIGFWRYPVRAERDNERWIPEHLARGTTPTVRNPAIDFLNFKHPVAKTENFGGISGWMDDVYKLLVYEEDDGTIISYELFNIIDDPLEENNIYDLFPEVAKKMENDLRDWQKSVEISLTGADYR